MFTVYCVNIFDVRSAVTELVLLSFIDLSENKMKKKVLIWVTASLTIYINNPVAKQPFCPVFFHRNYFIKAYIQIQAPNRSVIRF